jgi:uncharacterized protein (DUF58 family)
MTESVGSFLETLKNGCYIFAPFEAGAHYGVFYGRFPNLSTWARVKKMNRGASTGTLVFVIANFDREIASLEQTFGSIRQRHALVLLPVDDPADWDIPPMGSVVFSGPDGGLLEVDTDDVESRHAYRDEWEARRQALKDMANRLGITLFPIRTDRSVHLTLINGLQKRAKLRTYR